MVLEQTKSDIAVATLLRTIATTPGLGTFIGVGSESFDRLIEAAAERAGVELRCYDDYVHFWKHYAAATVAALKS